MSAIAKETGSLSFALRLTKDYMAPECGPIDVRWHPR